MSRSATRSICEGSCGAVRGVLVDTGALVALVRARDRHHALVAQFFGEFLLGELITTLPVLTEALHLLPAQLGAAVIELARGPRWRFPDAAKGLGRMAELMRKSPIGRWTLPTHLSAGRPKRPGPARYSLPMATSKSTARARTSGCSSY